MRVWRVAGDGAGFFGRAGDGRGLSGCVGVAEGSGEALRLGFGGGGGHVLVVGRSAEAALGILAMMLFDLATQIVGAADRGSAYTTPPFSVMDFHGGEGARVFGEAAMALPLPVKLERATDTAMTTLSDFQYELGRRAEPGAPRPAKFLFLCGLQSAHGIRSRGSYGEDGVNPGAARFGRLLREGPANALHLVAWCNSLANLELTVAGGLGFFRHVIVLEGGPDGGARYTDAVAGRSVAVTPFGLPSAQWCESFARGLG
ncbi:hypothetical protein AB0O91_11250 [Kitasatospora sp. NPDC089797]|uniref:hypothetical protein n=1 Tax=Kitasatospora sp. NPDC089797 TaxID=3155298 RepID=UPI00343A22B5